MPSRSPSSCLSFVEAIISVNSSVNSPTRCLRWNSSTFSRRSIAICCISSAPTTTRVQTEINGFSENGSIAPVSVSSDTQDSLRTDLGFRAWYDLRIKQIGLRPFVGAAWEHEYAYSALPISASLVDIPGVPVTVTGSSLGRDSAVVNAGVAVQWTRSFSTYLSYDGQLGRARYNSNGVSGGLRFLF